MSLVVLLAIAATVVLLVRRPAVTVLCICAVGGLVQSGTVPIPERLSPGSSLGADSLPSVQQRSNVMSCRISAQEAVGAQDPASVAAAEQSCLDAAGQR